ncbi:MAG: glycosyltransferase family 9 protein [Candidatus Rokubacteria bacterium]|nr:glycosyltransferase family 9 protein [Candidatus Rokubacteria bacterium]
MLAAQPRIGELLRAIGLVDRAVAFESLHLDALFREETIERGDAGPLRVVLRPPSVQAGPAVPAPVVSWFGSRDPEFVTRLTALVPDAVVAPSSEAGRLVWRHLLATVGAPLAHADRWRTPVPVPARLTEEGRRALRDSGWDGDTPLVVVHPGAGGIAKRWPAEGFAAVLERLAARGRITLAVHQGPADAEAVAALEARLRGPTIVLKEPSLPALAGMLRGATAYLGNDSGVSHLASALGVPSVVLFTADKLDWRPWARHVEVFTVGTSALDAADCERVTAAIIAQLGTGRSGSPWWPRARGWPRSAG